MMKLSEQGEAFSDLVLEIFRVNGVLLDAGDLLTNPAGLSSARWQVLGVVEHGPISVAHVARTMGLTRQSVQQTADGLEQEGFIAYAENPHHRRSKLMHLTLKGRTALNDVQQRHAAWANEIGDQHTVEQLRAVAAVLRQVRESLDQYTLGAPGTNEGR